MLKMIGERAEAEHELAPVRPREQAVEAVGKQELRGNERRGVIDLAPVVAPIQDDRALLTGLQVVLAAQHDFERHLLPTAQNAEQQPAPREQEQRGRDDGGAHRGTLLQQRELAEHGRPAAKQALRAKAPPAESSCPGAVGPACPPSPGGGGRSPGPLHGRKFKVESAKWKVSSKQVQSKFKVERGSRNFQAPTSSFNF